MENKKFNHWCIIELFGHSKIAGNCTEENIAGANMLRVDVPATPTQQPFTKYFGSGAIYSINPVDKTTAQLAAEKFDVAPVAVWQGEVFTEQFQAKLLSNSCDEVKFDVDFNPLRQ